MNIKGKEIDVFILVLFAFFAALYSFLTKDLFIGKPLFGLFAFTIPPTIYLGIRQKKNWKKIFVFTLIFGVVFGAIFEFFIELNNVYHVTSPVFPIKFFNVLNLDHVITHAFMAMLTVTFYEHFIDREIHHKISSHMKFALLPAFFVGVTMFILYLVNKEILQIKYPYLFAGIAAILPTFYLGIKRPEFIKNMLETALYFFFLWFTAEIVALSLDYWVFPGNYIGWVTLFGLAFPIEELFFWMIFYAATLVSLYELFIDDHSKAPHPHIS